MRNLDDGEVASAERRTEQGRAHAGDPPYLILRRREFSFDVRAAAQDEMRLIPRVVAYDVAVLDFAPNAIGMRLHRYADDEERRLHVLTVEIFDDLVGVGRIRAVVKGERDDLM